MALSIKMTLEIDANGVLSDEALSLEENEEILLNLRMWGEYVFGKSEPENQYYRKVNVTHRFGEAIFREVILKYAYLESYTESVDVTTGKRIIKLELYQKKDKVLEVGKIESED
jgi:hypothetical protein